MTDEIQNAYDLDTDEAEEAEQEEEYEESYDDDDGDDDDDWSYADSDEDEDEYTDELSEAIKKIGLSDENDEPERFRIFWDNEDNDDEE